MRASAAALFALILVFPTVQAVVPASLLPADQSPFRVITETPDFVEAFDDDSLGTRWVRTAGNVTIADGHLSLRAPRSFAGARLNQSIQDGVVSLTWEPHVSSAASWKELYVSFRFARQTCIGLSLPCNGDHRVLFALDDANGRIQAARFDGGLVGSGTTIGLPISAVGQGGNVGLGVPFTPSRPSEIWISHQDGEVVVAIDDEIVGVATYADGQTAESLLVRAADDGSSHTIDDVRFWAS